MLYFCTASYSDADVSRYQACLVRYDMEPFSETVAKEIRKLAKKQMPLPEDVNIEISKIPNLENGSTWHLINQLIY